jgi:hypothetical protein
VTNLVSRSLFALVLFTSARILACTDAPAPNDEVISTPGTRAPGPQGAQPSDITAPAPTSGGCEDFGSLSAAALTGSFVDGKSPLQATTFAVAGRSVSTKVRVAAVGDALTLVGKASVLGAGTNVNLSTCTHCLLIAIGCGETCADAAWFYPRSGALTLTSVASGPGQSFAGTFDNVELERVTVDRATMTTTPMAGGACIRVKTLSFEATTEAGDAGAPGTKDSGTGTTGPEDGGSGGGGGGGGGGYSPFESF